MEKRCIVSVIVPVFNVEKFLQRCIKSIQAQTYKDIEILLIDDGSTDLSGKCCDELAELDSRIQVIHKTNGGLSSARNAGLEIAKGEWISFVDSDDFICHDMIETMLYSAVKSQTGIAVCGFTRVSEEGNLISSYIPDKGILEGEALHRYFFEVKGKGYMCNKLFQASLLQNIRFPEGKLYEDTFVLPFLLEQSGKAVFIDKIGYYYTQRKNSITRTKITRGMDISRHLDGLEARLSKLKFMEQHYPSLIPLAKQEVLGACCWLLFMTYKAKGVKFEQNKDVILSVFHRERKGAEKKGIMILGADILITLSPWLFYIVYGIHEKGKDFLTNLNSCRILSENRNISKSSKDAVEGI